MADIVSFKNFTYYEDALPEDHTVSGDGFRRLMDLCFARADRFSLRRSGWAGARDCDLERELRPWRVGEYLSYATLHTYDMAYRDHNILYRANEDTKAVLLRHLSHLFDRDEFRFPEDQRRALEAKYAPLEAAEDRASDRYGEVLEAEWGDLTDERMDALYQEAYGEVKTLWHQLFREEDWPSALEDPTFFDGEEAFLQTVSHENLCFAELIDEDFAAGLRALGEWEPEPTFRKPLFSLREAEGLIWDQEVTSE